MMIQYKLCLLNMAEEERGKETRKKSDINNSPSDQREKVGQERPPSNLRVKERKSSQAWNANGLLPMGPVLGRGQVNMRKGQR